MLQVVNFKCDPILIGSLLGEKGFFPAYHMSKASWITVALDGSVADDKMKLLLDMSFEATAPKTHKNRLLSVCRMVCRVRIETKTSRESHEDSRLVC